MTAPRIPPITWQDGNRPTDVELVDWLLTFGPHHDLRVAGHQLNSRLAEYRAEVRTQRAALVRSRAVLVDALTRAARYRTAWWSARRRANGLRSNLSTLIHFGERL